MNQHAPTRNLAPGLHTDVPAERYHADELCAVPTLSSSIAGTLLALTPCHAKAAHPRLWDEPPAEKTRTTLDVGKVVHELILGRGEGFEVVDADDWRKKAIQDERDAILAAGRTPILIRDMVRAEAIAAAAARVIAETPGLDDFRDVAARSEVVGLWRDIGGPWCRMMVDRLTVGGTVYDIKTTGRGLGTRTLQAKIEDGLALQAGFYLRGLAALAPELAGRFRWRWIFLEQDEPYEARVVEPDGEVLAHGDRLAALAIEKWRSCLAADEWPGYPRRIERLGMPTWAETRLVERELADPDAERMVVSTAAAPMQPAPGSDIVGEFRIPQSLEP